MLQVLRNTIRHPVTDLITGSLLFASGITESWEMLETGKLGFHAHHGVSFYGLVMFGKAIADLLEGVKDAEEAFDGKE